MDLKELKKHLWKKKTLLQKIESVWLDILLPIQERWWLITGSCPHEGTIHKLGNKTETCILCGKKLKVK